MVGFTFAGCALGLMSEMDVDDAGLEEWQGKL